MQFKKDLDAAFHEFGKALAPGDAQKTQYNRIVNGLANLLQNRSKYKIDRIRPAGSFFKKSGLAAKMDLDIVFYLNNQFPPYKKVLDEFHDIILMNYEIEDDDIVQSPYSLQFSLTQGENTIDIDLVAATNFVSDTDESPDTCREQHKWALERIRSDSDPFSARRFYSGSLTEAAILFMKCQSGPVHELVRLAKYWKNSIYFSRKVSGLSSTIEMIAVYVGMEMEKCVGPSFSMAAAVERFLKTMKEIRKANIVFSHEVFAQQRLPFKTFYSEKDIPRQIKEQEPLVLDPADPYNNRLDRMADEFFALLSSKASESLESLYSVNENGGLGGNLSLPVFLILYPGPFDTSKMAEFQKFAPIPFPKDIAITQRQSNRPRTSVPSLISRNTTQKTQKKQAEFVKDTLTLLVSSTDALKKTTLMTSVQPGSVYQVIKESVQHITKQKMHPVAAINENDYQFTIQIPNESGGLVGIHFAW